MQTSKDAQTISGVFPYSSCVDEYTYESWDLKADYEVH